MGCLNFFIERSVNMNIRQTKKLEPFQLEELQKGRLYINIYDMDLKYSYEINRYWKEFFFDVIRELSRNHTFIIKAEKEEDLFDYFKKNYYNIIKEYDLLIDPSDYVEINDYITYDTWIKWENHGIMSTDDGEFYLLSA